MLIQLAWRSLWRVPKRTAIIFAAIAVGVWAMVVVGSIVNGMLAQMVDRDVRLVTGHLQIHRTGYFDDPVIDRSMVLPTQFTETLAHIPGASWSPRVRVPALVANARNAAEVTLMGVDPQVEPATSTIKDAVAQGRYLTDADQHSILMGERLARKLDVRIGETVVVSSEDARDGIAARGFVVAGLFKTERKDVEEGFVFVRLATAQSMLQIDRQISEVAVVLADPASGPRAAAHLRETLGPTYEVLTWEDAQPLLKAQLTLYQSFTGVWNLAVAIGIALGIANTMLMAIHDRFREFGIVKAIGMKPRLIVSQVMVESICLLAMGMIAGTLSSSLTVVWLARTGIDLAPLAEGAAEWGMPRVVFPAFTVEDLVASNIAVAILGALVTLYPAWKGSRIVPVSALSQR
jgi:ABC-type lipoprotein release transport system permease subunit